MQCTFLQVLDLEAKAETASVIEGSLRSFRIALFLINQGSVSASVRVRMKLPSIRSIDSGVDQALTVKKGLKLVIRHESLC